MTQIELNSSDGGLKNVFQTFWEKDKVDLSRGVDFLPSGPVFAAFTHLQHKPFTYRIRVSINSKKMLVVIGQKIFNKKISFFFTRIYTFKSVEAQIVPE